MAFTDGAASQVHRDSRGLGVDFGNGDNVQVDGLNGLDLLRLDLAGLGAYLLESVTFARVAGSDDYRLLADGAAAAQESFPGTGDNVTIDYSARGIMGNVFDFTAPAANDDYTVRALTVATDATVANPVPAPAPAALLTAGLLGLCWRHRRGG